MPSTPLTAYAAIEAGAEAFVAEAGAAATLTPATRRAYAADLRQFCRFLHTCIAGPRIGGIDRGAVVAFVEHLQAAGRRERTIARKLTAVRALFTFLATKGLIQGSPARGVRAPVEVRPSGFSAGEVRALLRLPEGGSFTGRRDRAMMELVYGCGLRLAELLSLNLSHLDTEAAVLRVDGPPRRCLPLGRQSLRALMQYLRRRAETLSACDIQHIDAGALFISCRGRRLGARRVQQIIEGYIGRLDGVKAEPGACRRRSRRGVSALRAAFAAHLLRAGADAGGVGALMGVHHPPQASPPDGEDLRRRYDLAHPRARAGTSGTGTGPVSAPPRARAATAEAKGGRSGQVQPGSSTAGA